MAYSTGSAATTTALKTIIESFASSNGFTVAGGIIKDTPADSFFKLTATSSELLKIEGAASSDFLTKVCASPAYLYVPSASWSVTYHLFYIADPKTIYCVVEYDGTIISWLGFGTIIKAGTGYTGGAWFAAQVNKVGDVSQFGCTDLLGGTGGNGSGNGISSAMPFWKDIVWNGSGNNSFIHAEIDGLEWMNDSASDAITFANYAAYPLLTNQPNVWNSQATLIPVRVFYHRTSDYAKDLGQLNGIRLLRTDNYVNGDIEDLSPDKWMIFSAYEKDTVNRNGSISPTPTTGTYGFAIKYDGP